MVVILMGVSGVGKTAVGQRLAAVLGWRFRDADDFHSAESIAKMATGVPLTDEDRWPWLERLRELIRSALESGEELVLACSALRRVYRERLTVDPARERWVSLWAPREVIAARLALRKDHYMPATLLDSQLATLEAADEALKVDVTGDLDSIVAQLVQELGLQRSS
ncbi:gluconokinase [Archangium sp.]|uniref:gluconokinase n=1 Tax=Archangium sp. TaxID=1872627 RepID=UPI00286A49C7|nr:gluconokinase [Archangium sp.]